MDTRIDTEAANGQHASEKVRAAPSLTLALMFAVPAVFALWPFISAIAWGAVLAIATAPALRAIEKQWPRLPRSGSAGLLTAGLAISLLIPLAFAGAEAMREGAVIVAWLRHAQAVGVSAPAWLSELPLGSSEAAQWWEETLGHPGAAMGLLRSAGGRVDLPSWAGGAGAHARQAMTTFVFAIATTFMLLHALERVGQSCRSIATALWGNSGRKALSRAIASIRGTADSVVMIGIAEGAILGIVFASVGVPHAGSLAIVAALAAAVPFGTATLGLVAAATEMAQGQPAMAAIVMALAISLVVIADYVVRPRLASGGEKMPLTLLLMSIIGGIAAFGLVGLFAGPAATCAAVGAWRSWTAEQAV